MQDFTVIQYGSDASEQFYGYWFNRITMLFKMLEKLTVLNGKRKLFIDVIDVSKLEQFKQFIINNNLYYAILNTTSRNTNYSLSGQHGTDMLRIIVSTDPILQPNDSREIGKLLGYPSEDIEFFIDKYENQKYIDPTWWQVNDKFKTDEYTKVLPFGSVLSTLLRWFGVRFVPNLPRDFYLCDTKKFADIFIETMLNNHYKKEVDIATQLLHSYIEYNTYNGIGMVNAGLFRLLFYSPNYEQGIKYTIIQNGEELQNADKRLWTLNGFSKYATMVEAHELLINIMNEIGLIDVCDLGLGNGILVMNAHGKKILYELDNTKIEWHKEHFVYSSVEFINKDISQFGNEDVDTYLISINRIIENKALGTKIYNILKASRKQFVIYSYDIIDDEKFYDILEQHNLLIFVEHSMQLSTNNLNITFLVLKRSSSEVSL